MFISAFEFHLRANIISAYVSFIGPRAYIHLLGILNSNAFCVLASGAAVSWE